MRISRLRAAIGITFAAVSLMAGTQVAEACTEPTLGDLPARAEEKKLVRFELSGVTPGSEYLVKVNGRERKSGVASGDKVSRRFRMPNMGDSQRRVTVAVVIANDGCENSPWKVEEKMTYRPEPAPQPEPEPPKAQPAPTPSPAPSPAPDPSPSPPPAPDPPAAPSIGDSKPKSQPPVPAPTSPAVPTTPAPTATTEPDKDSKAWVNPLEPAYAKRVNKPPKLSNRSILRLDQPSETANSTEALIGLVGVFLLLCGGGAIAWTKFRRIDEERLEQYLNPEGTLPTHLDPKAQDVRSGQQLGSKWRGLFRRSAPAAGDASGATLAAAAAAEASSAAPEAAQKKKKRRWFGRSNEDLAAENRKPPLLTDEEKATLPDEEKEELKRQRKHERKLAKRRMKKGVLPKADPTTSQPAPEAPKPDPSPTPAPAAAAAVSEAGEDDSPPKREGKKTRHWLPGRTNEDVAAENRKPPLLTDEEKATLTDEEKEELRRQRRHERRLAKRRMKKGVLPKFDPTAAQPTPAENGTPADAASATPPANGTAGDATSAPPTNGAPGDAAAAPHHSYRQEVESELQRILDGAGLHAQVDEILADARAEAQRQGVPIDSELMLRALCDDTNGGTKLSDSTRGELESRFKRIVAEERGGAPGS